MSEGLDSFLMSRKRNPKQREFFDERADEWDTMTVHDPSKVRYITDLLDIRPDDRVLDVGTGTGVMVPGYLEVLDEGKVIAIDYSERMIEVARSKFPESDRLEFRVLDIYAMDEAEAYDRIVCYSCFPHFPDPVRAIGVLSGALKLGGTFCIAHSSSREHINAIHQHGGELISNDYLPTMDIMAEMFSDAGLELEFSRDDAEYYIAIGRRVRS